MSYYKAHNYDIKSLTSHNDELKKELREAKKMYTYWRNMRKREESKIANAKKKDTVAKQVYDNCQREMNTYYKVITMYTNKIIENNNKIKSLQNKKAAITASKPKSKPRKK